MDLVCYKCDLDEGSLSSAPSFNSGVTKSRTLTNFEIHMESILEVYMFCTDQWHICGVGVGGAQGTLAEQQLFN